MPVKAFPPRVCNNIDWLCHQYRSKNTTKDINPWGNRGGRYSEGV